MPTPGRSRRGSPTVDDSGEAPLVVLDRTVFYPGGGGQPSDRGLLLRTVRRPDAGRSARRASPAATSSTSSSPAAAARRPATTSLTVDLDWARRYALMRTHTALHALCGVVWRDYGALVTGGNMEPGGGRMDFEFERMSGDLVDAIEATVNAELAHKRDVRVERPAARRGVRDPGPDPDEDQPAARGDRRDPDDRDRRARPPGRRRDPRLEHERGRRRSGSPATSRRAGSTSGSGWSWSTPSPESRPSTCADACGARAARPVSRGPGPRRDPSPSIWQDGAFVRVWAAASISYVGSFITRSALPLAAIYGLSAGAARAVGDPQRGVHRLARDGARGRRLGRSPAPPAR